MPHPVTGAKVVLTTAHVYDDRPEACSLLNLAALCQRCHNRHDMKDRARRRQDRLLKESGQVLLFTLFEHQIKPVAHLVKKY